MNFSLSNLSGTRLGVINAIEANESLPASVRAVLGDAVEALPDQFTGAKVHAHATKHRGAVNINITVTPIMLAGEVSPVDSGQ